MQKIRFIASGKGAETLRKVCGNFAEIAGNFLQRPLPERPHKWIADPQPRQLLFAVPEIERARKEKWLQGEHVVRPTVCSSGVVWGSLGGGGQQQFRVHLSGKSKGGLSKGGLGPKGANRAKKGPFGAISALPSWLWGAEELVPIGPEKAPIGPEKAPIWPEKARFSRKDLPPIFSENLGLKPPFVSPRLDFPKFARYRIAFCRRASDYSSNLCPPKIWSIWLFRGCFGPFYTRKRTGSRPKTPLKKSYRSYFIYFRRGTD